MPENQKEILFELEKARELVVSDPHNGEITLRKLLKKDHTIREDLQIKISLAYSLFAQTQINESLEIYEKVLKKANKHQYQEEIADAMLGKGTCYIHTSNLDEGISNCVQSIDIFKNLSLFEKVARANNILGSLHLSKGEFDRSLECYNNTMIYTKDKDTLMYTMALGNTALIYLLRGEMEKTVNFSRLSIKKAKKLNFYRGICAFQSNISDALRAMGEYSEALHHLDEGLELARKLKFIAETASMSISFAYYWIDLGELKKAYQMLQTALDIYEDFYEPQGHIFALQCLATYWLVQGLISKS